MNETPKKPKSLINVDKLRLTKANYTEYVLCNQEDPYKRLFAEKLPAVAGPAGSNLLAMVRISTAGAKAWQYRTHANKEVSRNIALQEEITKNHVSPGDRFVPNGVNNPFILNADGTRIRLCWHHSPNHINSISLISVTIHNRSLHMDGMGGRRFEIPDLRKTV
jgi:hypothetical protein